MTNSDTTRTILYTFKFPNGDHQDFMIKMDSRTLDILHEPMASYPEWTNLEYQKCSNCPLNEKDFPRCPIAEKLAGALDFFCQPLESETVSLTVQTPERAFTKDTSLKSAAVSLIGLYMATSGCPIMDKLRPMARFHLPLATTPETTYRSLANYLIGQYLLQCQGKEPDWELIQLGKIYDDIKTVNTHFKERLLKISREDCALNAILTLDAHAYYINLSLIGETFYTIESLFEESLHPRAISFGSDENISNPSAEKISYQYQFSFNNNYTTELTFDVNMETFNLINTSQKPLPSWTKLNCQKCSNCPLKETDTPYCPAAGVIAGALDALNETLTITEADVVLKTAERNFIKHTSVADGLSSLMSLAVPLSGCPVLGKLRPLACHHLPFESGEEQPYRSLGMYLLRQKFSQKDKENPDWNLSIWTNFFEEINTALTGLRMRLQEITIEDDKREVLDNLDWFSKYAGFEISGKDKDDLQVLFEKSFV